VFFHGVGDQAGLGDNKRAAIARHDSGRLLDQGVEASANPHCASHREACGYKPALAPVADLAH
jgi:hypothetical protein